MSDFTSGFWGWYVAIGVIASIAYCGWLLLLSRKRVTPGTQGAPRPDGQQDTTGHAWDGDLVELNNPLPKWWMWLFWITIAFSVVYLLLFPGLGSFRGVLDWSSAAAYAKESAETDARTRPLFDKYLAMDLEAVAADPVARSMGERLFLNNCAPCHGSDAKGSTGFPNLTDRDWLWGGDPEIIRDSIANGRMGMMPPFASVLGDEKVKQVVAYVRSLSGLPSDSLKSQLGRAVFMENCAACHGPEGKGMQALGAPNLTDRIWLYDSSEATIGAGIRRGRHVGLDSEHPPMPAHKDMLGAGKVHVLAAYVWGLSNAPTAK